MVYFWLGLFILLLIVEIATMALTTIWFAMGALAATIVSLFNGPVWLQIVLFLLVSFLMLFFTRPYAVKFFNNGRVKTNVEEIIGKQVMVIATIDNRKGQGEVMVNGLPWSARSVDDDLILEKDQIVIIKAVEGVKAMVEPLAAANAAETK